jgi:putative tryptophan/tyrosine transport system substrate-binding protein
LILQAFCVACRAVVATAAGAFSAATARWARARRSFAGIMTGIGAGGRKAMHYMKRRELITLLGGGAVAWPLAARAQQAAMPVIGYLHVGTSAESRDRIAAFHRGLKELGFVEGRNVAVEYRWADNQFDRLPELAADLIRRGVAVIAAPAGADTTRVVKGLTTTIPIVFSTGVDPVQTGLVRSLNQPGGNATGVADVAVGVVGKRLGLLHELLPGAVRFALLVTPGTTSGESTIAEVESAAAAIGRQIEVLSATTNLDIDAAFARLAQKRADALLVAPQILFSTRRVQLVTLAARHAVPTMFYQREYVEAGGLMSYGSSIIDRERQLGVYTGRILKGEKPTDLPILRAVKFEFVINLQTAKTIGLDVPPTLVARADEVIE